MEVPLINTVIFLIHRSCLDIALLDSRPATQGFVFVPWMSRRKDTTASRWHVDLIIYLIARLAGASHYFWPAKGKAKELDCQVEGGNERANPANIELQHSGLVDCL